MKEINAFDDCYNKLLFCDIGKIGMNWIDSIYLGNLYVYLQFAHYAMNTDYCSLHKQSTYSVDKCTPPREIHMSENVSYEKKNHMWCSVTTKAFKTSFNNLAWMREKSQGTCLLMRQINSLHCILVLRVEYAKWRRRKDASRAHITHNDNEKAFILGQIHPYWMQISIAQRE